MNLLEKAVRSANKEVITTLFTAADEIKKGIARKLFFYTHSHGDATWTQAYYDNPEIKQILNTCWDNK